MRRNASLAAAAVVFGTAVFWSSGGTSSVAAPAPGKVSVVAAEDFWGSIARQVGGDHAVVTSIITDPGTDPHDYEATPQDGALLATAQVAIVNGIGYDGWADKLLAANPSLRRKVVTVGDVIGVKPGGNPHQWYSPKTVGAVIDAITAALKQADPADSAYFDAQRDSYTTVGLQRYNELRARIKAQFAGTAVAASESIFAPLAADLGLKLLTPESFLDAISEGTEPTAKDKATVDQQITGKQVKVFVYNSQNSTPDVAALVEKAKTAGIPVTTVTETLAPKGTPFQDWQAAQLQSLADALARATGTVSAAQAPATSSAGSSAPEAAAPATDAPALPGQAPTGQAATGQPPLARTGSSARSLALLAGAALVVGGLAVVIGAGARRRSASVRGG
jgi:zinc/manganese transport system substrate-binding protein